VFSIISSINHGKEEGRDALHLALFFLATLIPQIAGQAGSHYEKE
jgi:hypothetical protein